MPYEPVDGSRNLSLLDDDLNPIFDSLMDWFLGATEPSPTYAGQKWLDTSDAKVPIKVRNTSNTAWKIIYYLGTQCGPVIDGGTFQTWFTASGLTETYYLDMPTDGGSSGQSLRIASITSDRVQLEWYTDAGGVTDIDGLSDVDTTTVAPSTNDVLTWDGSQWEPQAAAGGGGASDLDGLSDVTITSASSGDLLRYNGSAWVDTTLVEGDIPALSSYLQTTAGLDALSDVDLTTPATGQFLRYDGANWADHTLVAGDIPALSYLADTANLDDLANVTITTASTGDFLRYNGSAWVDSVLSVGDIPALPYLADTAALGDLANVNAPSPSVGNALIWGGSSWAPGTAWPTSFAQLSDTDISGTATGDLLQWDGSDWTNGTLESPTINDDLSIKRSGGTEKVKLVASNGMGSDVTLTLPATGTPGVGTYVLAMTNNDGVLSWHGI